MACLRGVTIGAQASVETQRLFEGGEYTKYLYLHGLSVETAEALAEFHHRLMRQELGIAGEDSPHVRDLFHQKYRGSRYSFGYPACPNLEDQTKLFALLHPEENVADVVAMLAAFLAECRVADVRIVPGVHADRDSGTGLPLLFKGDDVPPPPQTH